jgi:hypothetical protein
MTRIILVALVTALTLISARSATAQFAEETLLTAGVVKRIDLASNTLVLDNGRRLKARIILVNDQFAPITAVQPDDTVFVAGVDLGFEEPEVTAAVPSRGVKR